VQCAIRWRGVIKPGTVYNDVFSHQDMLPTVLAAAGEPDIVEKCKKGHQAGAKTFKVHLDGFNLMPLFKGEAKENPRPGFLYWSDEGDLMAIRYGDWKIHFMEQRGEGFLAWQEPFVTLRWPKLFNLRSDPFENADVVSQLFYTKWRADRTFMLLPAGALVQQYLQTMVEFPPRQEPDHYSVSNVLEKVRQKAQALEAAQGGGVK
jgi:arylsulfatase A-like enzyme